MMPRGVKKTKNKKSKTKKTAKKILKNVPEDKKFWVCDGRVLKNLRELEQALKRAFMLAPNTEVQPTDLSEEILKATGEGFNSRYPRIEIPESGLKLREILSELEKDAFRQAVERTSGNMAQAAALLGWEAPAFRKAVRERHPDLT